MSDKDNRFKLTKLIILSPLFFFGVIFAFGFSEALHFTNTTQFCTSCHTMQWNYEEYKKRAHYKSASGVRAGCSDCHVPKAFFPKMIAKVVAAKDVYHQLLGTIDTKEKFEKHRWDMANRVWDKMKATDSRECRSCHDFEQMNFAKQSKIAGKKHPSAMTRGKTCIECHQGVAHKLPEDPNDNLDSLF